MISNHLIPVAMIRPDLNDLPDFELPSGYAIHWYNKGDEKHWIFIQKTNRSMQ